MAWKEFLLTRPVPKPELHKLASQVSPAQARLLAFLLQQQAPVSTIDVRQRLSIGNVSGTAIDLSTCLERHGWQVRCELRRHRNKFGASGVLGWWRLEPLPEPEPRAPRRQPEGASA